MRKYSLIALLLLLLLMSSCKEKQKADYIFTNGTVYTPATDTGRAEAFAVRNGRFLAVGSNKDITSSFTTEKHIDLQGKAVYPGFIDPHCHFWGYGTVLQQADLTGTGSEEEMLNRVQEFAKTHPNAEWIQGRGWDNTMWPGKSWPSKALLDSAFPNKPVVLRRVDGHAIIANSMAIALAGMTELDGIANPQGIFLDDMAQLILDKVPTLNDMQKKKALLKAQQACFKVGLTSVHDAGMDRHWVELIRELQQQDTLKMRIYAMLNPNKENLELMYEGPQQDDFLHIRSLKLYADGALGSRGALLIEPYADKPATNGLLLIHPDSMRRYCELARQLGFQVNTHAIGDSAVRMALDVYSEVLEGENLLRWRIEHSQIVHPDDLHKFGDNRIVPSIQATHATSDMDWAAERLGEERVKHAYIYHELLEQNGWLPNGSDFPVEDINPLYGFYAAVARKDLQGSPEGGFMPNQALTREQALKAMTIWAAKAAFEEDLKGSIEVGKMADFVILEQDIMKIPVSEVPEVKVLETFLNGESVYTLE